MSDAVTLSVCIITYNHAKFIRQALDSVLMQKVDFPWEIIIADDCSTDGTREIIIEYQKQHPQLIRLILQEKNVGPALNWLELISTPSAKYIAYLEGDDYWIDSLKLQKQISFLELNPDCAFCYTNAFVMRDDNPNPTELFLTSPAPSIHSFNLILKRGKVAPSCTIIYRRSAAPNPWPQWLKDIFHGDLAFHGLIGLKGSFGYLDMATGVYRVHVSSRINSSKNEIAKSENFLKLMDHLNEASGRKYSREINFHRADHLEFLALENLKEKNWGNFLRLIFKSIRYEPIRGIPELRRGFYRFRKALVNPKLSSQISYAKK
ncbi:MAG: glycosyltransferase [Bacteroidetes bacterium]|nr:glycosyltransferase [Bacteroidota bacterium]